MKSIISTIVLFAALCCARAQSNASGPDVSITSMSMLHDIQAMTPSKNTAAASKKGNELGPVPIKCIVTIHNDFATASDVSLSMDFPAGISMISAPAGAKLLRIYPLLVGNAPPSQRALWQLDTGSMTAGQTITEEFIFLPAPNANKVTAHVSCYPNDINPNNNDKGGIY